MCQFLVMQLVILGPLKCCLFFSPGPSNFSRRILPLNSKTKRILYQKNITSLQVEVDIPHKFAKTESWTLRYIASSPNVDQQGMQLKPKDVWHVLMKNWNGNVPSWKGL